MLYCGNLAFTTVCMYRYGEYGSIGFIIFYTGGNKFLLVYKSLYTTVESPKNNKSGDTTFLH